MTPQPLTLRVRTGMDLAAEVFGDEGPVILLVMGIGAQLLHWHPALCGALALAGYRVVRFDNRDVGRSTWLDGVRVPASGRVLAGALVGRPVAAPYTLDDMADDALGLIEALGHGPAHVVGASMGGMIAQTMALRGPAQLRSLTSIMSSPGGRRGLLSRPKAVKALLARPAPGKAGAGVHLAKVMQAIGSPAYPRDPAADRALGEAAFERGSNPPGFGRQLAAIMASGSRRKSLGGVRAPTLVIHGAADPLILPAGGRDTARLIPGARLMMVPGMGHDMPQPLHETLVEAIVDHARRADAP